MTSVRGLLETTAVAFSLLWRLFFLRVIVAH
jgi:hypothetical protein